MGGVGCEFSMMDMDMDMGIRCPSVNTCVCGHVCSFIQYE